MRPTKQSTVCPLALAVELDWEAALVWVDVRFEYEELRMIALAPRTEILYYVAFCRSWCSAKNHQPAPSQSSRGESLCPKSLSRLRCTCPPWRKSVPSRLQPRPIRMPQPLTAKQLASMVPLRSLRGRPKSANPKQLVSVRYSPEVLAYFKSTGEGWQSRMDGVLREYVTRHSRRA